MWILPSKGRPHNIKRLFEAWEETKSSTPGIIAINNNDARINEYREIKLPDNWKLMEFPLMSMGKRVNHVLSLFPGLDWYGYIDDDAVPRTDYWDIKLVEAAKNDGIAYPWNGIKNEKLASQFVIGGDLVRRLGWIIYPGLARIYGDDIITDIGRQLDCLHYLDDVKLAVKDNIWVVPK